MHCPSCSAEIPTFSTACAKCGASLAKPPKSWSPRTWIPATFTVFGVAWLLVLLLLYVVDENDGQVDHLLEYLFASLIGAGLFFTAAICYAIGRAAPPR